MSEIENIVTTTARSFRFASEEDNQADPAAKEALRHRTTLNWGFHTLAERALSIATAIEVCRTINGVALDIRARTAVMNKATSTMVPSSSLIKCLTFQ